MHFLCSWNCDEIFFLNILLKHWVNWSFGTVTNCDVVYVFFSGNNFCVFLSFLLIFLNYNLNKYCFRLVLEQTVLCLWTVWFFVMFEVRFWTKIWCSEVFKVRSCCCVTRQVLAQTVWCSRTVRIFLRSSKFDFGPKCDVRYYGVRSKTIFHANNPLSFFTAHFVCQQRILCLKFHFKLQKHTFETSFNHSLYLLWNCFVFFHTSFLSLQTDRQTSQSNTDNLW